MLHLWNFARNDQTVRKVGAVASAGHLEEVCDAAKAHVVAAKEGSSAVKDEGRMVLEPVHQHGKMFSKLQLEMPFCRAHACLSQ